MEPTLGVFSSGSIPRIWGLHRMGVGSDTVSGFAIMFRRYDDISLLVSFVDIPVGLGNLFQRIRSVDDRFYLSRLNQFFE